MTYEETEQKLVAETKEAIKELEEKPLIITITRRVRKGIYTHGWSTLSVKVDGLMEEETKQRE